MDLTVSSRTNRDISYSFSDKSPAGLVEAFPHLGDNFALDSSKFNYEAEVRFEKVIGDCAHPDLEVSMKYGIQSVIGFIKAFGIRANPLYVYTINRNFYKERAKVL